MGCNCKQKSETRMTPTTLKEQAIVENKKLALDFINELELALTEYATKGEQKQRLQKFFLESFGQLIPDYCDTICQRSIKKRLEKLKQDNV